MAKQVQFRRGTTSQHSTFTGAAGEITVDTDKNTAVVHDGSTAGGHPLATSLADLGVTASAADLNTTDVTTLGTVEASKVVTADASKNISSINAISVSSVNVQSSSDYGNIEMGGPSGAYIDMKAPFTDDYDARVQYEVGGNGALILNTSTGNSSPIIIKQQNNEKLRTSSAGIDVTGELIADSYNETYAAVTSSSNATTVDCEAGNAFSHTLTENTTFTFSNPPASGTAYSFSIEIIQDASASGYTVTWPSSVDWPSGAAPTLTATASAKDVFVFTTRDGGTNWYGFTAGLALA